MSVRQGGHSGRLPVRRPPVRCCMSVECECRALPWVNHGWWTMPPPRVDLADHISITTRPPCADDFDSHCSGCSAHKRIIAPMIS
eukprot:scaffold429434_cov41-Prasinocladus_malaysianus.AAC.1